MSLSLCSDNLIYYSYVAFKTFEDLKDHLKQDATKKFIKCAFHPVLFLHPFVLALLRRCVGSFACTSEQAWCVAAPLMCVLWPTQSAALHCLSCCLLVFITTLHLACRWLPRQCIAHIEKVMRQGIFDCGIACRYTAEERIPVFTTPVITVE